MNARIKRSFTTSCRVDVENIRVVDTSVTHVQRERQACSFFATEIQGTIVETLFQLWSASSRRDPARVDIIFFPHVQNLDGEYRAMFLRSTSFDTREANKSEVRILFWEFPAMPLLRAMENESIRFSSFFLLSPEILFTK